MDIYQSGSQLPEQLLATLCNIPQTCHNVCGFIRTRFQINLNQSNQTCLSTLAASPKNIYNHCNLLNPSGQQRTHDTTKPAVSSPPYSVLSSESVDVFNAPRLHPHTHYSLRERPVPVYHAPLSSVPGSFPFQLALPHIHTKFNVPPLMHI